VRPAAGPRRAALAALLPALLLAGGCAPGRQALRGEEARTASEFFAACEAVAFPVVASFTASAEFRGRTVPFVAGVNAQAPGLETLGLYDPLGHAVLLLDNEGGQVRVSRGPAAEEFPDAGLDRIPPAGIVVRADGLSFGRILAGAPGYPVTGGEPGRGADGAWVLSDGPQTLFTDPSRRLLARAEYEISGRRVTVSYPGREGSGPPRVVAIEARGAKMMLRRDVE